MNYYDLLDYINIKTYPELIINQIKNNHEKSEIKNLRSFYNLLFNYLGEDIKASYLNRILKYLSAKEASNIAVLDDIASDIFEVELIEFFKHIDLILKKDDDYQKFYKKLLDDCLLSFFTLHEKKELNELYTSFNYPLFLYKLFKHACMNYRENTPKVLSERLLYTAFSIDEKHILKRIYIKTSADLGNDLACLLYGNYVYNNYEERLKYFLKGKGLPNNIWEIAFIIEHFELNNDQLNIILKELKEFINIGKSYVDYEFETPKCKNDFEIQCIKISFYLNLYLSHIKKYDKGYTSIGKYFLEKIIVIKNNEELSIEKGMEYSTYAAKLGNINAIQNIGTYYYLTKANADVDYKELLRISADAKDLLGSMYYSQLLIDENNIEEAEKYLKFLSDNEDGASQYQLAMIYEKKGETTLAIDYYKKSIKNNCLDAVIKLSKLYFNLYMFNKDLSNENNGYLLLAINLLEEYYFDFKGDILDQAAVLLKNMKSVSF